MKSAIDLAVEGATDALGTVKTLLGADRPQRVRLTPQQQLDRFVKLTPKDFENMRLKKGDVEFQRYWQQMLEYSRRDK